MRGTEREKEQTHPYAWTFFVIYILVSTFAVLSLFIGIMVDATQKSEQSEEQELQTLLAGLDRKIEALNMKIDRIGSASSTSVTLLESGHHA